MVELKEEAKVSGGGFLNEEQEALALRGISYTPKSTQVYRQYVQTKNSWEYTLYYKDENGKKHRVDCELYVEDISKLETLVGATNLDWALVLVINTVIKSNVSRNLRENYEVPSKS